MTSAFVRVDKDSSRAAIFQLLIEQGIPFIDVGMSLQRERGALDGMLRTTYFPLGEAAAVRDKQWAELHDATDDLYRTNIQIGELNALNACLAVIRFKQLRGFFTETSPMYNTLFEIGNVHIIGATLKDDVAA